MPSTGKPSVSVSAVPLQNAVLCVECECISVGRLDRCAVCGSPSLLSVAKLVGGANPCEAQRPREKPNVPRFDAGITIDLREGQPAELSTAMEAIVKSISGWLANGRATCHVDVVPEAESARRKKAA